MVPIGSFIRHNIKYCDYGPIYRQFNLTLTLCLIFLPGRRSCPCQSQGLVEVRQGRSDLCGQADESGAGLRQEPDEAGPDHEAHSQGGVLPTLSVNLLHRPGSGKAVSELLT